MKIIGCASQMANGKDSVCDHLAATLNKRYKVPVLWNRLGFATAVKKVYMDTFKVSWDFIETWKRKEEPPPGFNLNVRKSLQFIGDGFRQIKEDIWLELALRENLPKIISDVRYLNEAQRIRSHGGLNILLWRKDFENDDPNPSESEIKPTVEWFVQSGLEGDMRTKDLPTRVGLALPSLFDFFLRNEGTLEELKKKIDALLVPAIEAHYEEPSCSK